MSNTEATTTNTCQSIVHRRKSLGIMGKGTESFTTEATICGKPSDGSLCKTHQDKAAKLQVALAAKRIRDARELARKEGK
jgi:hypothetical protein